LPDARAFAGTYLPILTQVIGNEPLKKQHELFSCTAGRTHLNMDVPGNAAQRFYERLGHRLTKNGAVVAEMARRRQVKESE